MRTGTRGHGVLGAAIAAFGLCSGAAGAADDVPDLTGVWGTYGGAGGFGGGGGLDALPIRDAAREKVEAYRELVAPAGDTPGGFCLGSGMPGSMLGSGGYPMEIVQHEDIILVVYEAHAEIRRIYLTDRAGESDLFPDRNGYSFGRWEGDTLLVETTHLKEALDQRQFPHSDRARIVEEYELTEDDDGGPVLVATMTMTDPEFYTEPVSTVKRWSARPGARLLPYECNEPAWEQHLEQLRASRDDG